MPNIQVGSVKRDTDEFKLISKKVKDFSKILEKNTPEQNGYVFYRGKISSDINGVILVDYLVSDLRGNYLVYRTEYNPETDSIYYGSNVHFMNEKEVISGLMDILVMISDTLPYDISEFYFDCVDRNSLSAVYVRSDDKEIGSLVMYASAGSKFFDTMCISESNEKCKEVGLHELSVAWVRVLKLIQSVKDTAGSIIPANKETCQKCLMRLKELNINY